MKYKDKEMIFHVYECSDGTIMIREKTGEIVRCKDCVHYETAGCKDGYGFCNARIVDSTGVTDDHFCADGERKDGEHE